MKILVFAKQIPDVNQVKYDPETNRIVRENVPLSMNSFDRKAVEEAIRIKEKNGAETIVATMGPPQAGEILNDAMRMGIDRAFLITDRKFGGSDTLATAKILSSLVSRIKPDLVLTGKYSLDGETAQVPPEIAVFSGYAFKSSIDRIEINDSGSSAVVQHENEQGTEKLAIPFPAVLSVSEKINRARAIKPDTPDMTEKIERIDAEGLGIDFTGSGFSPTVVTGTTALESSRKVRMIDFDDSVYERISAIISENRDAGSSRKSVKLDELSESGENILGVIVGNSSLGEEISSKISELAAEAGLNVLLFGNVDPSVMKLSGHEYYYYPNGKPESFTGALEEFIREKKPKYVVFPSTVSGREIAGTIAARLEVGLTADCVDLEIKDGKLIQYKPAFGGGIIASIYSRTDPQMTTVRPGMFRHVDSNMEPRILEVMYGSGIEFERLENTPVPSEYRPLGASNVVVGMGRGFRKKDRVPELLRLAGLLDASLGATRPLVDMGFVPRQQQIGLTGVSISPGVYLALGISGQANHVVGIRYCNTIIAVNSDPEAPIFRYSDYGVVADANEFLEGYIAYLEAGR